MDYSFQEGIPAGFTADFDFGIFHHPQHLHLQAPDGWHTYVAVNSKSKTILALVNYHIDGLVAKSPYRSPYGSFLFSTNTSEKFVEEFVKFTEQKLRAEKVKTVWLKNPPLVYAPQINEMLNHVLIQSAYTVLQDEVSAVIPVSKKTFQSIVHRSEKKRLRKCHEQGLTFQQVSLEKLAHVYQFLIACREEKGYRLSMTLQELIGVTKTFPDHFILTVVSDGDQIAAANISVRVNSSVLYNFYHDHKPSYDALSPVVLLNEGLYQFCQQNQLILLDLGTSNANDILNKSLLNFKLRLGAQPSRKLTFVKNLS